MGRVCRGSGYWWTAAIWKSSVLSGRRCSSNPARPIAELARQANKLISRSLNRTPRPTRRSGIAATDYVRAVPESIRAYLPQGRSYLTLGTDGFGRSDTRAALRGFLGWKRPVLRGPPLRNCRPDPALPAQRADSQRICVSADASGQAAILALMRLKHIEVFNAIMLTGTVSAAARLLHVTQPAVTQTLQHAELQLGYVLFTRQKNRLVPTHEAQALYPEIQTLVSQLEAVRRLSSALGVGADNQLRILIVPSLAVRALPDALQHFRKRYPNMQVSIRTLHSREIAQAIVLREADVGIVYGNLLHPALHEEPVSVGRLVCVSRVNAPGIDHRTTVALEDIVRNPFIRIDERDPLGAMLADQWSRLGLALGSRADIMVQTHHIAMVLAEEGFGPAIIDSFTAQASRCDSLHVRAILPEVPVEVTALLPQGLRSPKPVSDFIEDFRQATRS